MLRRALQLGTATLFLTLGAAQARSPWLHVQVLDDGGEGTRVNVNLPLSLVKVAIDVAGEGSEKFIPDHIDIDNADISVTDLKRMWRELRDAGDAELFEVEDDGEHVRIFQEGGNVHVHVSDKRKGTEKVKIEVPKSMVDALLEGDGPHLNLHAALATLSDDFRGDLVTVEDGETSVRVWVD